MPTIQHAEIVLATTLRVPKDQRDQNLHYYDVRSDDDGQGIPCEVANFVFINHLCTIATNTELQIGEHGYILSKEEQYAIEDALYQKI